MDPIVSHAVNLDAGKFVVELKKIFDRASQDM